MQGSLRELPEPGPRRGKMTVPIVLWLHYPRTVKPKWTMEKTQCGQGPHQIPGLAPACAAAACTSASLPTATRRQERVNPASRGTQSDRPLLGNGVHPPHMLQQELTTYLMKGSKPKSFILIITFLGPQIILEVVNTDA